MSPDPRSEPHPDSVTSSQRVDDVRAGGDVIVIGNAAGLPEAGTPSCIWQAPAVDRAFVERVEMGEAAETLCEMQSRPEAYKPARVLALRGAGGFGKTSLAKAICQQERIRQRFPDGVLWSHVGCGSINVVTTLRDTLRSWAGGEPPRCDSLEDVNVFVQGATRGKTVLWVLDDVQDRRVLEALASLRAPSALMITTRDHALVPSGGAFLGIGPLLQQEAVQILAAGLDGVPPGELEGLASLTGNWPLLLQLCNGLLLQRVRCGMKARVAIRQLEALLADHSYKALERPGDDDSGDRAAAVATMVGASFDMGPLGEKEREAYLQLGVFPESTPIPLQILECLWQLPNADTQRRCEYFEEISLVANLDFASQAIEIHPVLRRYLLDRLGGDLQQVQRRLLDSLRPSSGSWRDLKRDQIYLWRHLFHHLDEAGWVDSQIELLTDFRFLERKIGLLGSSELISDLKRVDGEQTLASLPQTLRRSIQALQNDPKQLASQLLGRLESESSRHCHRLIDGARRWGRGLLPRSPTIGVSGPLEQVFRGHDGGVNCVLACDPRQLASASRDRSIRIWDRETGNVSRTFQGHKGWVTGLASIDDRSLVSASEDATLCIWDLVTGSQLGLLEGHEAGVLDVARVDAHHVVSCSRDGSLALWNLPRRELVRFLRGHEGAVFAVAVFDNGRVASCSADGTVRLWDLSSGAALQVLAKEQGWLISLCRVGRHVASGSYEGSLDVWHLESRRRPLRTLKAHCTKVRALSAISDSEVVSAGDDGVLKVWDIEEDAEGVTLQGLSGPVTSISPLGGRRVVTAGFDRTLRIWNLAEDDQASARYEHEGAITGIEYLGNGRVAVASDDGWVGIWILHQGWSNCRLRGHEGGVLDVCTVGRHHLASCSFDQTIRLWSLDTHQTEGVLRGHTAEIVCLATAGSRFLVSGSYDHTVRVWDLGSRTCRSVLTGHTYGVHAVVCLDSRHVASASADKTIIIWDLESGRPVRTLRGHSRGVFSLASLDSTTLVSGSRDGTLRIWNWASGGTVAVVPGLRGTVRATHVLSRRLLATSSDDSRLSVWDLRKRLGLATFQSDWPVRALTSLDSTTLVAGDTRGRIHCLDLKLG